MTRAELDAELNDLSIWWSRAYDRLVHLRLSESKEELIIIEQRIRHVRKQLNELEADQ